MDGEKRFLLCWAGDGVLQAAVTQGAEIVMRGKFPLAPESAKALLEFGAGVQGVLCPGGCLGIVSPGTHPITEEVRNAAADETLGRWDCDAVLETAAAAAEALGVPAYYTEAMSADTLLPLCRIGSHAAVPKYSRGFRAEHLAMLRSAFGTGAAERGNYIAIWADELVSVGAYSRGRCLDMNDCIGAEGPMGFTSSGDVPCAQLGVRFASCTESLNDMCRILLRESGLFGYTGTTEPEVLDQLCAADANAKLAVEAMAYQIAKWAGSAALVLQGAVDGIVIGGKGVRLEALMAELRRKLQRMAPITEVPETDLEGWLAERAALLGSFAAPLRTV